VATSDLNAVGIAPQAYTRGFRVLSSWQQDTSANTPDVSSK
jgi:hypothetical protein